MKGRQLLDAMAYIDDALIEEAAPFAEKEHSDMATFIKKRDMQRKIMACAAVFAVAAVSLWVWKNQNVSQERVLSENGQYAGAYDTGGVSGEDIDLANAPAAEALTAQEQDAVIEDMTDAKEGDAGAALVSDGVLADAGAVEEAICEDDATDDLAKSSKGSIVKVIEEFPLPAVYCYAAPEKGSSLICAELKAAMNCYDYDNNTIELAEPEQYLYHVTIQVFGETQDTQETDDTAKNWNVLQFSEEGKEKLSQEYERMCSEGLAVTLSEDYKLTGMFGYEEIENFVPYPEYGYVFQLVNEN